MKNPDYANLSILVPVRIDSPGRLSNLEIIVRCLQYWFPRIRILITECDSKQRVSSFISSLTGYQFYYSADPIFYRTRINNSLIDRCETAFAGLYDADIVLPPDQLEDAFSALLSQEIFFAYPFDGRFVEVGEAGKKLFSQCLLPSLLTTLHASFLTVSTRSAGGCFIFNVERYRQSGKENENIIGWGHDDVERARRLKKLGERLYRSPGPLYHLFHERGKNSFFYDQVSAVRSFAEYFRICSITPEKLKTEIPQWQW